MEDQWQSDYNGERRWITVIATRVTIWSQPLIRQWPTSAKLWPPNCTEMSTRPLCIASSCRISYGRWRTSHEMTTTIHCLATFQPHNQPINQDAISTPAAILNGQECSCQVTLSNNSNRTSISTSSVLCIKVTLVKITLFVHRLHTLVINTTRYTTSAVNLFNICLMWSRNYCRNRQKDDCICDADIHCYEVWSDIM